MQRTFLLKINHNMFVLEGTGLLYTQNIIRISREGWILISKYELYLEARSLILNSLFCYIHVYLIKTLMLMKDGKLKPKKSLHKYFKYCMNETVLYYIDNYPDKWISLFTLEGVMTCMCRRFRKMLHLPPLHIIIDSLCGVVL